MRAAAALAALVLLAAPAEARRRHARRDPRTAGLGKSCQSNRGCRHPLQVCLHENDANGKLLKQGLCALPCTAIDVGLKKDAPPATDKKQSTPPRCPKRYECRSAGQGVPIDMCVKQ